MLHQTDSQGYMIPRADLECDELTELGWSLPGGDPDFGPAEGWPAWTDESTWEEGPAIPPDAALEPFEPTEDDLADYAEWSAYLERGCPAEFPPSCVTDADVAAAGLA